MSESQDTPSDEAHLRALNAALREENENLRAIVQTLKRALYGARSEKQSEPEAQLPLSLGDLSPAPIELVEPAKLLAPANSNRPQQRSKAARNIGGLPAHLPRVDIVIEPQSKSCPCCQGPVAPDRRRDQRNARRGSGRAARQTHSPAVLWLPLLRRGGGAGQGAGTSARWRHADRKPCWLMSA